MKAEFTQIYETNRWGGRVSRSGKGSDPEQTRVLVPSLKRLIARRDIHSVVDLGCGDLLWMWDIIGGLETYVGVDIVHDEIEENRVRYGYQGIGFTEADATRYLIPTVDAILCRDVLCHLEYEDALRLIENVKKSKSTWFIAGTYPKPGRENPVDLFAPGQMRWYPPVLTRPPFNLPEPEEMLFEGGMKQFVPGFEDKSLGVWRVENMK
jgi:SAM-dependent methyltransferase